MQDAKSTLARVIYRVLDRKQKKSLKSGKPDLNISFICNMPFRGIAKMTNGMVSMEMAEGMVMAANGQVWNGLLQIVGGWFRNRSANKKFAKKLAETQRNANGNKRPPQGNAVGESCEIRQKM